MVTVVLLIACGPGKSGESAGSSTSEASEASGASSTAPTTGMGQSSTTGVTTTGADETSMSEASTTTGASSEPIGDPEFCPIDWPAPATVAGTTPSGPFTGARAWFGWAACNVQFPAIYVFEDPAEIADAIADEQAIDRALVIAVPRMGWDFTAFTGESEPWVFEMEGGSFEHGTLAGGEVTLSLSVSVAETVSPVGTPRIVGEFALHSQDGEWDLSGAFDAAYCGPLPDWVPVNCE
ncbi:hypothetical protein SAMN02745121_01397 [Nannocystis exedens]|uniref:Uncharacterized protein n=1 Tax=Nannocystis exedens TaxID=54 RepID=A0A1I1UY04_9BACT|nr:hypothetical protein NAEX_05267 [Nannocystis exedens]SFD75677.1 hypothetical protein SAMN02745121_01397 [Nannocystis exedens]